MLKEFLSHFWQPLTTLQWDSDHGMNYLAKDKALREAITIHMPLEQAMEFNRLHPLRLDFTPNGNYWDNVWIWSKLKGVRSANLHWSTPYYHAFIFDFDIKDFKHLNITDHEWLRNYIVRTCYMIQFRFTFVSKTPWWFHCYTVFAQEDKSRIFEAFSDKIIAYNKYFMELLWADVQWFALNKTLRLPTSLHWKTGKPLETTLHQLTSDFELLDTYDETQLVQITYEQLEAYVQRNKNLEKHIKKYEKISSGLTFSNVSVSDVNSIPFPNIFEHLRKYPRFYKWESIQYSIDWSTVVIEYKSKWPYRPDWYKYREEKNAIVNFSFQKHDRWERPVWSVLSFLCWYFWDKQKVSTFLNQEYWITVNSSWYVLEWEQTIMSFQYQTYTLYFTTQRCILETLDSSWAATQRKLFWSWIEVLGKAIFASSIISQWNGKDNIWYIFKVWDKTHFVPRVATKREFNQRSIANLFFYWNDNDIWLFFEILDNCVETTYETVHHNWYYDHWVYLWWIQIVWDFTHKVSNQIQSNFIYPISFSSDNISVKDFYKLFIQQYDISVGAPAFLWALAIAWMNLWTNNILNPWLLITWLRWSWKSTMKNCLSNAIWIPIWVRSFSLWCTTKQPLSLAALDPSPLALDELTGYISIDKEQIVRNIVNKDSFWIWMLWLRNIEWKFSSPLIVSWERMFFSESINNRFIIIPMSQDVCKWSKTWLHEIEVVKTCYKDVYQTYYNNMDSIESLYLESLDYLQRQRIWWRLWDVWAYIIFANRLFDLQINEEDIIKMIDNLLTRSWLRKMVATKDPTKEFFHIVMQACMKNNIYIYIAEKYTNIIFDQDIYNKNQLYINDFSIQWNSKQAWLIEVDNNTVIINHPDWEYWDALRKAVNYLSLAIWRKNVSYASWYY